MRSSLQKAGALLAPRRSSPPTLTELDSELAKLETSLNNLAAQCGNAAAKANQPLPPHLAEANLQELFTEFAKAAPELQPVFQEMAAQVRSTRFILLDGSRGPRIVPGLNPASYDRNEGVRRMNAPAQPWLDLQAILYAPKSTLEAYGYPFGDVETVRTRFAAASDKYKAGDAPGFAQAMTDFASSVRYLANAAESRIPKLPVSQLDENLVAAVAYPTRDALDDELLYNRVDPFFQTWIVSFLAGICFALAFGWARKPMIWAGFLLLLVSIGISIFGFALRVSVTQWAPVTNMYETVIYVSTIVAILGAWFLALPVTWRGLNVAWRMTALPGTPEAVEVTEEQQEVFSPETYKTASLALLLPRLLLAAGVVWILSIADYAAGGQHIINLVPNTDYGSSIPNANNLTVWLVGLSVLACAVWWVPRTALALAVSLVTIPLSVARSKKPLLEKVYEFPRPVFGMAAAFVACFGALVAWYAPNDVLDPNFKPLQPVLRDNFWLTIHVLTIVSSYAAGALAWGLGNIALGCYLFGRYRTTEVDGDVVVRAPEVCAALAGYVYKVIQVAVLLLAAGTILGGLWADVSWGRFWGWDPKEVWALASLLVYLAILHGRYAGWFNNFGLAVGSVL
ncbi:MAG TPA: cytochrome c biogenesis protein CcsA, partial [Pirellulales bacterium]